MENIKITQALIAVTVNDAKNRGVYICNFRLIAKMTVLLEYIIT